MGLSEILKEREKRGNKKAVDIILELEKNEEEGVPDKLNELLQKPEEREVTKAIDFIREFNLKYPEFYKEVLEMAYFKLNSFYSNLRTFNAKVAYYEGEEYGHIENEYKKESEKYEYLIRKKPEKMNELIKEFLFSIEPITNVLLGVMSEIEEKEVLEELTKINEKTMYNELASSLLRVHNSLEQIEEEFPHNEYFNKFFSAFRGEYNSFYEYVKKIHLSDSMGKLPMESKFEDSKNDTNYHM